MSETMTPETGNGTVQEAANQFLGMMEAEETPEGQDETVVESEEEEEVDEEESEDSEETDDEGDDEEQESEPTYHVKMAGEEREITQSELIKLAQQGADYTKKSQQISEQRKALDAEAKAISEAKQLRDQYAERLEAMQKMLQAQQQPDDDLDYLQENDPIGYAVKVADMTRREKQMYAIEHERQRIAHQQEAERTEHNRRQIAEEAIKVSELIPDYSDSKKGALLRNELRDYAKSIGYTDAEIGAVYDSRTVKALYDASQYQKLVNAKPSVNKKVQSAPKTVRSGTSPSKTSTTEAQRKQFKQLQATGRVRDAATVFENFI